MLSETFSQLIDSLSYLGRQTWFTITGGHPKRPFNYTTPFSDTQFLSKFLALPAELRHQVLTETLDKEAIKQLLQLNLRKVLGLGPTIVMELYFDAILSETKKLHPILYEHMIIVCKSWRKKRFMAVESRVEMVVQYIDQCRTMKQLNEEEQASQADLTEMYAQADINLECWSDLNWLTAKTRLYDRILDIYILTHRNYSKLRHDTSKERALESLRKELPKARDLSRPFGALRRAEGMEELFWDWIFEDWDVQVEPNYFMRQMIAQGRQSCLRGSVWKSYVRSD